MSALGGAIDVGEAPVPVEGQKTVTDAGQDALGPFLSHLRLAAQLVLDTHGLAPQRRHVEIGTHTSKQFARTEWFGQIVVRPGRQTFYFGFFSSPGGQ
jgi:hypothetical protein